MVSNVAGFRSWVSAFGLQASAAGHCGNYKAFNGKIAKKGRKVRKEGLRAALCALCGKFLRALRSTGRLLRGFLGPLCQGGQERVRGWGRLDVSVQQGFERDHAVVEFASAVFVLLHDGAVQADAGEHAAGTRVGQYLRAHLPIRAAFGVASNGTGRYRGVGAEFKFAGEQVLHAVVVHDEHDQINRLAADLKPDTASGDGEKCRSAPSLGSAAAG